MRPSETVQRPERPDPGFKDAWAAAAGIQGWLSQEQGRALWREARSLPGDRWIVEVGSHHGKSTVLVAGAGGGAGVHAVDPFDDPRWGGGEGAYGLFLRNLRSAGVDGWVKVFRGRSADAARVWPGEPVGLLYVDGAHDLRSVLADIDGWEPFVAEGGAACFHDAFSSVGVTVALLRRHLVSRSFRYCGSVGSLAVFRRERLSSPGALLSGARMAARLPYLARNLMVKAALRRGWHPLLRPLGHRGEGFPY